VAMASDIPCSSESKKLEFYSCQMWRKPYKVGLKTEQGQFCETVKKITPANGCVINELLAKEPAFSGDSKDENTPRDDGMHIFIIGPSSIDASSYELQIEPQAQGGIIAVGLDIVNSLPGFTILDMPDKDNSARISAWVDAYKAKGKKFIGAVSFRAAKRWTYPEKKLVTLIKYKAGKKLYEIEANVEGYKPTYGSAHGGNSDKPGAGGAFGTKLKGIFGK
jgi:hypothetical protein